MDIVRQSISFQNNLPKTKGENITVDAVSENWYSSKWGIWPKGRFRAGRTDTPNAFEFKISVSEISAAFLNMELDHASTGALYNIEVNDVVAFENEFQRGPGVRTWDLTEHLKVGENKIKIRRLGKGPYSGRSLRLKKIFVDTAPPTNALHVENGSYLSIPHNSIYQFGTGAFSAMAYITPNKVEGGKTVLTEGTIFSSKPARGNAHQGQTGYGGWQIFLEKEGGDLMLCFKTDDGNGYHLLKAPLNNLYDDKAIRNPSGVVQDTARAKDLFREYTHFIAAVRETNGALSLYANGYLLAKVIPYEGVGVNTKRFQLKGVHKETIDAPTHYFTVKRDNSTYEGGYANWDADGFESLGNIAVTPSMTEEKGAVSHKITREFVTPKKEDKGHTEYEIKSVEIDSKIKISNVKNQVPSPGMLKSEKISLYLRQDYMSEDKLLAQFFASNASSENVDNSIGLCIGQTKQHDDPFEGYIKHVSLWNKALSQKEIIKYVDREVNEEDSENCVGFWKLEEDLKDSSKVGSTLNNNHAVAYNKQDAEESASFIYRHTVLPIYVEEQQDSQWCWAASALSIIEFYDPMSSKKQTDLVKEEKGQLINKGVSSRSYLGKKSSFVEKSYFRDLGEIRKAINELKKTDLSNAKKEEYNNIVNNYVLEDEEESLTLEYIIREINNWNPICISVRWWDRSMGKFNGGHVGVLSGIKQKNGVDHLVINDPIYGIQYIKFENFIKGKYRGSGYWNKTYITRS